jgi:vacuolar-type H+-ATPase subunit E/Vma4
MARRQTRSRMLQARNAFLERVFAAAIARLPGILEAPARTSALHQLVQEAVDYFPSTPAAIRCRRALADRLNGLGPSLGTVSVVPDESVLEGVVVAAADGSLAVDNTLVGRLRWLRPMLSIELVSRFEGES